MLLSMPSIEYPITRDFPGRLFAPFAFAGAFILIGCLAVINAALVGYETVTGFHSNFNVTQTLWFNRFLPMQASKAGKLCDPRLLSLGDTVTTNYTLFQYTLASIEKPNAGDSSLSYKGWTLENCDITSLYVTGNADTFIIDSTVTVSCRAGSTQIAQGNNYEVTLRTDWPESTLAGKYGTLLGVQKVLKSRSTLNADANARGRMLTGVTDIAASDFAIRMLSLSALTNTNIISFQADFPWCPAYLGRDAPCAQQVPLVNVTNMFVSVRGNDSFAFSPSDSTTGSVLDLPLVTNYAGVVRNLVQSAYATIRLDLGNPALNNFLLAPALIPSTLAANFTEIVPNLPSDSFLYAILVNGPAFRNLPSSVTATYGDLSALFPLAVPGPAVVDGVYLCRFQRAKSPGSAFIAVLVATLSMFSSAWGVFVVVAAGVVKRRGPNANACAEHYAPPGFLEPSEKRKSREEDSI
ncbi:hypothetical protein B0H15DRAFT_954121 [Mycena belliarum]|uniref:Transmembrane protein n=1 Tax=Mycena belliarum TaxID=1033014 RepID=A0AAD6TZ74_9AGAR|nr:hypothetical protein B0H15DRAFT_954121 [Mycena belliae]